MNADAKAVAGYDPRQAVKGERGWRAAKGPQANNTSGFRATGHRLLLLSDAVEEVTSGGIVLAKKTIDKERSANVYATVVEIGHDAWSDKSTDFCEVGDRVLIGQYTGKFQVSERDGKEYRFVTDLDIISTVEK
jgi:co-chaperonin GroES (HSP10)